MNLKLLPLDEVPVEIASAFERTMQRVIAICEGGADPDRPIEQLEESFDGLIRAVENLEHKTKLKKFALLIGAAFRFLADQPRLRGFLARKVMRDWRAMIRDAVDTGDALVAYVHRINAACPGASLLALGGGPLMRSDFPTKWIQANTYLAEASSRAGEARFNSTKKLARVVLDELYPHYLTALCILESARLGESVTKAGKQARSFGSMVGALKN